MPYASNTRGHGRNRPIGVRLIGNGAETWPIAGGRNSHTLESVFPVHGKRIGSPASYGFRLDAKETTISGERIGTKDIDLLEPLIHHVDAAVLVDIDA